MIPDEINTLDEAVDAFNMARDEESDKMFDQSDIAARTCIEKNRHKWGMNDEQILAHIGTNTDTSMTTMWGRLIVGRVFPKSWRDADENVWCKVKRWSHFEVCARQWSETDPEAPMAWLQYCVDHDLSVSQLKMDIKVAKDQEPPQERPLYLLSATPCYIEEIYRGGVALRFEEELAEIWPDVVGQRVFVTVVKEIEQAVVPLDAVA